MIVPLLVSALVATASPVERGTVDFRPGPDEASVPKLFRLEAARFAYELEPVLSTSSYTVARLRFPSPVTTADAVNNTVHAEFFQPRVDEENGGGRFPAVIVLHILGADFPLSRYMAARLADRGVAALFVKLPYYGERQPPGRGLKTKKFFSENIERTTLAMRQGICDVRRAVVWLQSRPEVDPERLGATGISLGGIVSSITTAVDPSIHAGAFLLAGGDLARIVWDMPEAAAFRANWLASGRTRADLKRILDPFDPLAYAPRLVGKRTLMIAGKVDEVVPPASTRALWNAAGRPPIHWYDCGHYSAVGYLLPALRQTVDFFAGPERPRERLGRPAEIGNDANQAPRAPGRGPAVSTGR